MIKLIKCSPVAHKNDKKGIGVSYLCSQKFVELPSGITNQVNLEPKYSSENTLHFSLPCKSLVLVMKQYLLS